MTEQEKQAVETLTRSFTKMETLYKVKCTEVEAREGEISRLKSENAALHAELEEYEMIERRKERISQHRREDARRVADKIDELVRETCGDGD